MTGVYPGLAPRLMIGASADRPLTLTEEQAAGTYSPVDPHPVAGELERAGLRGRGGAGFPAHVKWRTVAGAGRCVVVANGEEGEPASLKDRWLLTHRPHAVLDGLALAAKVTGAERAIVYLSHPETVSAVTAALRESPARAEVPRVEVHRVAHRYVAGEESAVCRSINGGPALPAGRPPRVFESGVDGVPTLVSNVETLVHAAWIARHGADAYRALGTEGSPGTGLVTIQGACARPGVFEVPYGVSVRDLLAVGGADLRDDPPGLLMGGWFGGIAGPSVLDATWCFDALAAAGSALGCGAVTLLGAGERVSEVAARLARWYAAESAGQCGVCRKGTAAIADALERVRDGAASETDAANLARWGTSLRGKGACAFLDGAATVARTASENYSKPHIARG